MSVAINNADFQERRSKSRLRGSVSIFRVMLGFTRPYRKLFLTAALFIPMVTGFQLAQPYVVKIVIDRFVESGNLRGILICAAIYFLCFIGEASGNFLQNYFITKGTQFSLNRMRNRLMSHLMRLPLSFYDRSAVGALVSRATNDVESINELLVSGVISLARDFIMIFAVICMMIHLHLKLAIISLALMPLLVTVGYYLQQQMRRAYMAIRKNISELNGYLAESLAGISIIKLFQREKRNLEEFNVINLDNLTQGSRATVADAALYSIVEGFSAITIASMVWFGGKMINESAFGNFSMHTTTQILTFGTLVAFIEYLNRFFNPLRDISAKFATLQMAIAAGERIANLLEHPEENARHSAKAITTEKPISIEFVNTRLSYNEGYEVLKGIDLKVAAGERLAIVGATGSGKTSLVRLLLKFYQPTAGSIVFSDGDQTLSINDVSLASLRRLVGMVPQDVDLFLGTVGENIVLQNHPFDETINRQLSRVLDILQVQQYLDPAFQVVERGSNLSAGQKQLIALGRILFHDPKIVILDEATSNIDTVTEKLLLRAVDIALKNRTAVVVAHRLSTVQNADRIVVMHKGEIVASGTHAQLMKQSTIYSTLVEEYRAGLSN